MRIGVGALHSIFDGGQHVIVYRIPALWTIQCDGSIRPSFSSRTEDMTYLETILVTIPGIAGNRFNQHGIYFKRISPGFY
jgi:hypothetical protein